MCPFFGDTRGYSFQEDGEKSWELFDPSLKGGRVVNKWGISCWDTGLGDKKSWGIALIRWDKGEVYYFNTRIACVFILNVEILLVMHVTLHFILIFFSKYIIVDILSKDSSRY